MHINIYPYEEDMSHMFSRNGVLLSICEKKMLKKEQWRVSFSCCQIFVDSCCMTFLEQAESACYEINRLTGSVSNNIDKEIDLYAIEALVLYLSPNK